ncbi:PAS domain-containing protein [uncultured Desulfuromonas sp.]|uniref:PAS domain-containing protein n=1 Tax=uncultured Desulfuromonas sp. TaxID=181013 RepID=UPI002AAC418A|nr:PAS domain-containing protein [uncultured Desulfuromonas sp.]
MASSSRESQSLPLVLDELENMPEQQRDLLFRSVNRFGREVVCWFDSEENIRYISPNCLKLFGWEMEQFLDQPQLLEQMIHPDDRLLWEHHQTHPAGHQDVEIRIQTSGGTLEWMEYRCLPLVDKHGQRCGRIATFLNISRRHEAQYRTQALALALEQSPTGIVVTDNDGNVLYANEAFHGVQCRTLGVIQGRKLTLFSQEYREQLPDLWPCLDAGQTWKGEKVCSSEGQERVVELVVTPVLDQQNEVTHILFLIQDVTRQRQDQQLLHQQHEQLRQLFDEVEKISREWALSFDSIDDIMFLMDGAGHIQRINQAVERHYGEATKKLTGASVTDFLPEDVTRQFFDHGQGEFYDDQIEKWFSWQAFDFLEKDEKNQDIRVVTLHDVTARHQLAEQLEKSYESQKKAQSQLVQQEKMASIGQLAAGVAHEINNPVGFIHSNLNTLGKYLKRFTAYVDSLEQIIHQSGHDDLFQQAKDCRKSSNVDYLLEDTADLIEESIEGTTRVSVIVKNLKSFSRVDDAGLHWTDLRDCLEASLSIAWNEIKYNCRIEKEYGELPQVFCNPQQLNQVLLNLLVNAAQAIEQHGVIHLKTWADEQWAHITVNDNGCGMSDDVRSRIFDPFFTTKKVGEGTGLGLSICYDIITKHHGLISVKSAPGKGTEFHLKLPLKPTEESESVAP